MLLLLLLLCTMEADAASWVTAEYWNAVPRGAHSSTHTFGDCQRLCEAQWSGAPAAGQLATKAAGSCRVFAWNSHSKHCFLSDVMELGGVPSDHVTSGCDSASVEGCKAFPFAQGQPHWAGPQPDPTKPLGGYEKLQREFTVNVLYGNKTNGGSYNHNVMIDYQHGRGFLLYWKNCETDEDCNGQRMLYASSADGRTWSNPAELFPNMTATAPGSLPVTLEPGPPLKVGGRLFAAVSPGIHNTSHDASAQGSQFCLWPDPVDPRNCGPASDVAVQYSHTLLLREFKGTSIDITNNNRSDDDDDNGATVLGDMFWASTESPALFEASTKRYSIPNLGDMDNQTQQDISSLSSTMESLCEQQQESSGTTKCEFCSGGCQLYNTIDKHLGIANERTHWNVPSTTGISSATDFDVMLYRAENHRFFSSVRKWRNNTVKQTDWPAVQVTNIPNDNSNLNAGKLPDGRIYLVHNPVTPHPTNGHHPSGRDPITLSTSKDGLSFENPRVIMTCTDLPEPPYYHNASQSQCLPRFAGNSKNAGPSYPQAVAVVDPAPKEIQGFYLAASNNKEDIYVTKVSFDDIP